MVMMNVLAFILCLCAIFLPSMPNEDGKTLFFFFQYVFFLCCFSAVRLFTLPRSISLFAQVVDYMCVCVSRMCVCIICVYVWIV